VVVVEKELDRYSLMKVGMERIPFVGKELVEHHWLLRR
jgi:hypothetical protein